MLFHYFLLPLLNHLVGVVVKDVAKGAGSLRINSRQVKSATVATAATFLCCPGAMPRRWDPPLHAHFGVITKV